MGGMANQMFQYAFGVSVAKRKGEDVKFMWREGEWRPYLLDDFNARIDLVKELTGEVFGEPIFAFDSSVYDRPRGSSFIGHWQTERYFADNAAEIREAFTLRSPLSDRTKAVADEILAAGDRSAFLHVRRTDYLIPSNVAYHGGPTQRYYEEAVRRVRERYEGAKFFVFSDEPEWCKANFPTDFTVVDHNPLSTREKRGRESEDLYLMSLCRNGAIANSSFSWWGAWLHPFERNIERLVFAPKRWFVVNLESRDIVPERWIKLDN